jgi:enediyne biosynthesis protein E4
MNPHRRPSPAFTPSNGADAAAGQGGLRRGKRKAILATACLALLAALHGAVFAIASQRSDTSVRLPIFRDVARGVGLDFVHINGASEQRFLPETLGPGGLFLDFDNDGWLDVFLVDGGSIADAAVARRARHRLYRNRGNGTFQDVTATSGIRHRDYGMGACAGDYDNDGLIDLYVTSVGSNQLYHNADRGRFTEVPNAGGADPNLWSTSCAFLDADRDGNLDLFVTNYVDALLNRQPRENVAVDKERRQGVPVDRQNPFCGIAGPPPVRDYCHPLMYPPLHSALYRNTRGSPSRGTGASTSLGAGPSTSLGAGPSTSVGAGPSTSLGAGPSASLGAGTTFEDISRSSGVAALRGNGLGVAVADVDDDGWPDVFVANDAMPNFLFHNDADGTFSDIAGIAGVAVTADGKPKAGMGTAFADFGGNGRLGLIVTNHEAEMHSVFLNLDGAIFSDVTVRSGVGPATRPYVGFGVAFFDYDNDTDLDIAIANGHVMANVSLLRGGGTFAQRNLLLRNSEGRFQNVTNQAGPGFAIELVSRALAAGDVDNDGDLDLLVTNNGAGVNLLLNEGVASRAVRGASERGSNADPAGTANAILVRAIGTKSNRSGIGTRLTLTTGGRRQLREVQSGSSYLTQNDLRAHFGLGAANRSERLQIRWPSGATEVIEDLPANHIITVREGEGVVGRMPFTR